MQNIEDCIAEIKCEHAKRKVNGVHSNSDVFFVKCSSKDKYIYHKLYFFYILISLQPEIGTFT